MVDRPPPSRLSVVERDGRLVVVDRTTGKTPPSAAERMAEHDRRRGLAVERPSLPEPLSQSLIEPSPPPKTVAVPAAAVRAAKHDADAAPGERKAAMRGEPKRTPWADQQDLNRPEAAPVPAAARARIAARPAPAAPDRKTIVTGKWWDEKGPRTIELGPKGQQVLSGGFVTLAIVAAVFAITLLLIEPVLLFVVAFLAFQFGSKAIAPLGASIVDKALAERQ